MAAKTGGGDPGMNPRLRSAILTARSENMPNDNVERAVKRGTGEIEGAAIEEIMYEAYAPGGVAMLVEIATDNKNRAAQDVRVLLGKYNASLASSGSVAYLFQKKGLITVTKSGLDEDRLLELALDAGADDFSTDDEHFTITTPPEKLYAVAEVFRNAGVTTSSQKLTFVPNIQTLVADETTASQVIRIYEVLDDYEDTQNVYANFDIPDELLSKLS